MNDYNLPGKKMNNTVLSFQNNFLPELYNTDNKQKQWDSELQKKLPENTFLKTNDFSLFSNEATQSNRLISPVVLFSSEKNKIELPPLKEKNNSSFKIAPDFAEVKKGAVIENGQNGPAIKELQNRLNKLGFGVKVTGEFGNTTEKVLKQFQKRFGVAQTGKFGATTLSALEIAEKANSIGAKFASQAKNVARSRNTFGRCYNAVADAVDNLFGDFLRGGSAYMAANQLASSPKFKEVKVNSSELPKLSAGAIVVWGKTPLSPDGHISVALGDGREASDHITEQLENLRGYDNFRVFLPIKT